jgi:hypothetical protein
VTTLGQDIARIAALRGSRPVENYIAETQEIDLRKRTVSAAEVRSLFRLDANIGRDLKIYDRLPSRSRMVIAEAPICMSATKYADLLMRMRDEEALIEAVRDQLPGAVRNWVLDHFGPKHPSARRLA